MQQHRNKAFTALLLLFGIITAAASLTTIGLSVPHKLNLHPPQHYRVLGKANAEHTVRFTIALKQQNVDVLESRLLAVSDPKSSEYGNHMTLEQITQLVKPSLQSVNKVRQWLESEGCYSLSTIATEDFLIATAPVRVVEKLFSTELYHFTHASTGRKLLRANSALSVPSDIAPHIGFVGGLTRFPDFKPNWASLNPYLKDEPAQDSLRLTADTVRLGADSNMPVMLSGITGNQQLSILVRVVCKDNSYSTDAASPCSDHGTAVSAFNIELSMPNVAIPQTLQIPLAAADCFLNSADSNVVNCRVTLQNLKNYVAITVAISTQYADASQSEKTVSAMPAYLSQFTTPQNLHDYYGINFMRGTNPANRQSVAEFLDQYYADSDLQKFFADTGLAPQPVGRVIGPNDQSNPGAEATLDIEYIMAIGLNITTDFWSVAGGDDQHEPFLEWLLQLSNTTDGSVPLVHSVSYGDVERGYDTDTLMRLNVEFMKAGARGLSIIFSSGDDGTGNAPARDDPSYCKPFTPSFPASSPYVTSVGATQFSTYATPQCFLTDARTNGGIRFECSDVKEIACSSDTGGVITSGGGFSDVFAMPRYQEAFVKRFLGSGKLPDQSLFNSSGRAYPDVSTMGHNFLVVLSGNTLPIHGTSASAPLFAGMIALLNDIRLNNGGKPLGFLNPWLYQVAETNYGAFYDITVGNNNCTASYWPAKPFCCEGFSAAPGYDPLTGLGSPRFDVLKAVVEKEFIASSPTVVFIIVTAVLGLAVIMLAVFSGVLYYRVRDYHSEEQIHLIQ